jgi:hypothetical protein
MRPPGSPWRCTNKRNRMRNGQRSLRSPVASWYPRRRAKRGHSLCPEMEKAPTPVAFFLLLNLVFRSTISKCPYGALSLLPDLL